MLASRLTDDKDKHVLVLEAGDEVRNEFVDIPIFADKVRGSELDWQYQTVPQKHACKSHEDKVISIFIYFDYFMKCYSHVP